VPSEITHIAFAQRFLEAHPRYEVAEFMSGTIFPDIRVLGTLERYQTHALRPGLKSVLAMEESWWAGFLFHRYLDLAWDRWVRSYGVDPANPVDKRFSNAVKLLGDVVFYREIEGRLDLAAWLWRPRGEELTFGVEPQELKLWHGIIAGYLMAGPTPAALRKLLLAQRNSEDWVDEVMGYLRYIEATPVWMERLKGFDVAYD
jgi:hypothetical protein